jgi:hypothetical protein
MALWGQNNRDDNLKTEIKRLYADAQNARIICAQPALELALNQS